MKLKFSLIVVFAALAISSCKRSPYPESELEAPVFRLYGTYDGGSYSLLAGENSIYLNSFSEQDAFGVRSFITQFNSLDCVGCSPKFEIQINDNEVTNPGAPATLDIGSGDVLDFVINEDDSDYLTIQFHAQGESEDVINWDFGDGNTGNGENPEHTYSTPGIYVVTMEHFSGEDDNHYIITQTLYAGNNATLSVPFNIEDLSDEYIVLSYPNQLPPDLIIEYWTINGEIQSDMEIIYNFESEDEVEFCLHYHNTLIDEDGTYCISFYDDLDIENYTGLCSYQWSAATINLDNVQIQFRSVEGDVYSTITELNQQNNNQFSILSVEEYTDGIDGQPAKIIRAQCDAALVNINDPNDIKSFVDMEIVFGMIYK
ncbi:MAG: PKD domain-containing protein [Flavobacteriales bacterium]